MSRKNDILNKYSLGELESTSGGVSLDERRTKEHILRRYGIQDNGISKSRDTSAYWSNMPVCSPQSRVANVVSGAVKSMAAQYVNAAATMEDSGVIARANATERRAAREQKKYQTLLEQNERKPGSVSQTRLDGAKLWSERAEREAYTARNTKTMVGYDLADTLNYESERDINRAKRGLNEVGKLAVDAGVAGIQLAADAGASLLTGGSAAVPAAIRSFGDSTRSARCEGATLDQQMIYGMASVGVSALTGQTDPVAKKIMGKTTQVKQIAKPVLATHAGQSATQFANTKAGREFMLRGIEAGVAGVGAAIETAADPLMRRSILHDRDAQVEMKDVAHNFITRGIAEAGVEGSKLLGGYATKLAEKKLLKEGGHAALKKGIRPTLKQQKAMEYSGEMIDALLFEYEMEQERKKFWG